MANAITRAVEKTMNDGGGNRALAVLLYLFSLVYSAGVAFRLFLYSRGILKKTKLRCPVISIGNITVGGTGKTPMTIFLAREIMERGKRAVILTRGYGGRARGIGVVSDGTKTLMKPDEAGDEPVLMANRLKGVPVIVGKDRVKAGLFAIEKFNPDVILLDDGFQHIRLERDLNIMLMDSSKGLGNGFLLPRGILREGASAMGRADFAMLKGVGSANMLPKGMPTVASVYRPISFSPLHGNGEIELKSLKNKRAVAVCAIASPESFLATLEGLGVKIVKKILRPDHHPYSYADALEIKSALSGADVVVTTEKDAVKFAMFLDASMPIYALKIDVELKDASAFKRLVGARMAGLF